MDNIKDTLIWDRAVLVQKIVGMHRGIDTTIGMGAEELINPSYLKKYNEQKQLLKSFEDVIQFYAESENGST